MEFLDVKRFCAIYYGLGDDDEPTKAQRNSVARMCRNGTIPALRIGKRWFVVMDEILKGVGNA